MESTEPKYGVCGSSPLPGHLPGPQLVEDLAGLGVPVGIELRRLVGRQHRQRLDGELRAEGEGLERGDQRVPAEQRA